MSAPEFSHWWVCGNTWFVGVDALPTRPDGAIGGSGPLTGAPVDLVGAVFGQMPPLHPAQLSIVRPGYPKPRESESGAAFRYRRRRDAAHVDGLRPRGPDKRRFAEEPHAFILGLPLNDCSPDASPLVVWEGSHRILRTAFLDALAETPVEAWAQTDLTEVYTLTRREIFETCRRVELPARPGEAVLLHPLTLHGVAPWGDGATAPKEGRMIAYFRPILSGGVAEWLSERGL